MKVEPHALRFGEEAALSIRAKRKQLDEALDYREREAIEQYLSLTTPTIARRPLIASYFTAPCWLIRSGWATVMS